MDKIYWLNKNSRTFLSRGYLEKDQTPEERIRKIADGAEKILGIKGFADKFESYMHKGWYSLSSPVWANFANKRGYPISCNGATISDKMEDILYKVAETGMLTKHGAGTSAYFGDLRARGAPISGGGVSSGPVHFMELFDNVTRVVSQSNVRRGSFAAYLPIEHADVEEFLGIKGQGHPIQDMSFGLTVSDEWMKSMTEGDKDKRKLWAKVIKKRFESGYPYIIFIDTVNKNAPQAYKDKKKKIKASNLCVTGDQRVPSNFGLKTVKELHKLNQPLKLFDNNKVVNSSPMKLIKRNAEVYKITLMNGMTHTVTKDHKIPVLKNEKIENMSLNDINIGDNLLIQNKSGVFGSVSCPKKAYLLGISHSENSNNSQIPDWIWEANKLTQKKYINGLFSNKKGVKFNQVTNQKDFLKDIQIILANLGINSFIDNSILHKYSGTSNERLLSFVKNIEYIGKEDVYCCTVNSPEHHWICNGVVTHNCSEIMLSTSEDETFVCNLMSINLLHWEELKNTDAIETAIYFLDAVMSEYIEKTEGVPFLQHANNFAKRQRALGLGTLGWHSFLQSKMIPFESMEAKFINGEIYETMQTKSYAASRELAKLFGEPELLKGYGMRNATTMAIAPTTSSSFILGQVSPSIEPLNSNYFVEDSAKGKFTYRNPYLKILLEAKDKDTPEIWKSIMMKDGSVQHLNFLSKEEKDVFKTFGEISQKEIVIQAAQRQKYIDQSQSLNLTIHPKSSPKDVNELMIFAWEQGVKSLYYQRGTNPSQELGRTILNCASCEA